MDELALPTIHYLDGDFESALPFMGALGKHARIEPHFAIDSLLAALREEEPAGEPAVVLLDMATLRHAPTSMSSQVIDLRLQRKMALVSNDHIEPNFMDLRRWGLLQVAIKCEPLVEEEIGIFLSCVRSPENGFGLMRYLSHTVEMYSRSVRTIEEKVAAIELATNHFATQGFDVHELYDVRLALEELLNNALFHAFQIGDDGQEKYSIRNFKTLEPHESVRIEYGSDGHLTGFTVSDSAGTLPIKTVLAKLERQYNREGLYDENGRGLYLTRMLSSQMIVNIEAGKRTQIVVLFDARRKTDRPKPFMLNYTGPDTFAQWGVDPDFD